MPKWYVPNRNICTVKGTRHGFAVRYAFQLACARLKRSEHPITTYLTVHIHHLQSSTPLTPEVLLLVGPAIEQYSRKCRYPFLACAQSSGLESASPNFFPGELTWCSGIIANALQNPLATSSGPSHRHPELLNITGIPI